MMCPHSIAAFWRVAPIAMLVACAVFSAHALSLRGILVDTQDAPVSGADVWLRTETEVRKTRSGEEGAFLFENTPVGACEVVAYKEGLAIGGFSAFLVNDADMRIVLEESQELSFRVINQNLFPVPGARIKFMLVRDAFRVSVDSLLDHGFPRLRADDNGIIAVPFLPKNAFVQLLIAHYRYADTSVAYLPVGGKRQDIILQSGVRLGGRIMNDETPIANAHITVLIAGAGGRQVCSETISDPEGFYSVYLPDGEYYLVARHPEYASPEPKSVLVSREKEDNILNLDMIRPHRIEGRILLDDQSPAPGVWVEYSTQGQPAAAVHSDAEGRFALLAPSPQGILRIIAPPGYMTDALPEIPVNMGETRHARLDAVRLLPLPQITGTLSMPDGRPAARVVIASRNLPHPLWTLSDEDGRFGIQLTYPPDTDKIGFVAEHPTEFLSREFTVDLKRNRPLRLRLRDYKPEPFPEPPQSAEAAGLVNQPAPDIECAHWFNSTPLSLADMQGKIVLLLFWGGFDDSPDGVNRIEETRVIHAAFLGNPELVFLGIHDDAADPDEVSTFIRRMNIEFPVGLDAEPSITFSKYHIRSIPHIVLLDKQGLVRYAAVEDRLLDRIKSLLARGEWKG